MLKKDKKYKAISRAIISIIIVVIIVAIVGGIGAYYLTRAPTSSITSTSSVSTSTSSSIPVSTSSSSASQVVDFINTFGSEDPVGLKYLQGNFSIYYPGYIMQSEGLPGASGVEVRYVIVNDIEAGKLEGAFWTHAGPEVLSYVELLPNPHDLYNLTPVLQQEGLFKNGVRSALLAISYNGTIFSSPMSVDRGEELYFNPKILREYNLPIPTNLSMLIYDTQQLESHGITPWAVSGAEGGYEQLHLWFAIFLSVASQYYGPAGAAKLSNQLMYGVLNLYNTTIQKIINETDNIFVQFVSPGAVIPSWQSQSIWSALALVIKGQAAFEAGGNWLAGYATNWYNTTTYPAASPYLNWTNISLMAMPFPGTQGIYVIDVDAIAVPALNNPQLQAAVNFVKFVASYNGMKIWTYPRAVSIWDNATDYYKTPSQWYDYQDLLHTAPQDFTWAFADGSLFDDVFYYLISQELNLQEQGLSYIPTFNAALLKAENMTFHEWQLAAKDGFGFVGIRGEPFGDYLPPWVNPSTYTYNSSYMPLFLIHPPHYLLPYLKELSQGQYKAQKTDTVINTNILPYSTVIPMLLYLDVIIKKYNIF
ncbi:glucose ABC transporter substrate-binding protein GlcS [Saccharolobus islandicus]|uniref:glucose ABC transporter substrate-binding protein GlcS n=1 Tax=Saccharolobus islandicus TaxID=43080 RepID=UPI000375E566|nr:glucose ABC transporter substrate-binding protein GlcS [Sulfolobus islandicus]